MVSMAGWLSPVHITSLTRLGEKREATVPILELREALGEVIATSCGLFSLAPIPNSHQDLLVIKASTTQASLPSPRAWSSRMSHTLVTLLIVDRSGSRQVGFLWAQG